MQARADAQERPPHAAKQVRDGTAQTRTAYTHNGRSETALPDAMPFGVLERLPRRATALQATSESSFNNTTSDYKGQIYGIFLNAPKLTEKHCVYVGKTIPGKDDVGVRFVQHVDNDQGAPWYKMPMPMDEAKWKYVPRQIVDLKEGFTKAEVALWESWAIMLYRNAGADLLNKARPITTEKAIAAVEAKAVRKTFAPDKNITSEYITKITDKT